MSKTAAALKMFTVDLMTVTTVFHSESLDMRSLCLALLPVCDLISCNSGRSWC